MAENGVQSRFPSMYAATNGYQGTEQAKSFGLDAPADQQLYALCYLNGEKKILESETVRKLLPGVVNGKESLANVLSRASES